MTEAHLSTAQLPVIRQVGELRRTIAAWRAAELTVGLVPTMGGLHAGHLALVRRSQAGSRRTIVTLFVNPTQFGSHEDFAFYPRDEAGDAAMAAAAGAHALFAPDRAEMYPPGHATTVTMAGLADRLCGPFRPGHFAGVATVVAKLLLQALPDAAYFGEKDYQQLQIVRRLVRDLDIPVRIVGVPTVREADGLALSSRNRYLSAAERAVAAHLPQVMTAVTARLARWPLEVENACAWGRDELLRAGFAKVDYLALADPETLEPVLRADRPGRLFVAVSVGKTRLIDNLPLEGV